MYKIITYNHYNTVILVLNFLSLLPVIYNQFYTIDEKTLVLHIIVLNVFNIFFSFFFFADFVIKVKIIYKSNSNNVSGIVNNWRS